MVTDYWLTTLRILKRKKKVDVTSSFYVKTNVRIRGVQYCYKLETVYYNMLKLQGYIWSNKNSP